MEQSDEGCSREFLAMFRPPINRAMRSLDRSFFRKTVPISAARVFQHSDISRVRKELSSSKDLLVVHRLNCVRDVKDPDGLVRKALLLRGDLKHDGMGLLLILGYMLTQIRRQDNMVSDYQ